LLSNYRPIENHSSHPDQHFIANGAGMHDCGMADRYKVPKTAGIIIGKMNDGVVLDIRVMANHDAIDIAAENGMVPNAGPVAQGDIADNHGAIGDINAFAEHGLFPEKTVQLLFERVHAKLNIAI
jgi:hypothetical protein